MLADLELIVRVLLAKDRVMCGASFGANREMRSRDFRSSFLVSKAVFGASSVRLMTVG